MATPSIGARLATLAGRPHTEAQILKILEISQSTFQNFISRQRMPAGYQVISWRSIQGKRYYEIIKPEPPKPILKPQVFRYITNHKQAYHRVFIPNNILDASGKPASKIMIYPFSDVHWGHKQCDKKNFLLDIKMVAETPNMLTWLNGDIIDNALGDSAGGAAWSEQDMDPRKQRFTIERVLQPIRHKTLFMLPGNHEERTDKKALMNPLEEVAHSLDTPYFAGPVNMEIVWQDHVWSFYCFHGKGNSGTTGGQINTAARPRSFNDFRNFFVSGHVHNQDTQKYTRPARIRRFNESDELTDFEIVQREEFVVILPSYLLYDESYGWKEVYKTGSRNTVMFELLRNGKYHVVTKKRSS